MKSSKETTDSGQEPGFVATPEFHADSADSGGHFTREKCEASGRRRPGHQRRFVGVWMQGSRWAAVVVHRGQEFKAVGLATAEDAARERDRMALEIKGPTARLNFPTPPAAPAGCAAVQLTRGMWAIVDEADYVAVSAWKWSATKGKSGGWYARRAFYSDGRQGSVEYIRMHREIVGASPEQDVDHRNGNSLDNRRENIRVCTPSQNTCNRGIIPQNTSGLKGACFQPHSGKWRATITVKGKQRCLGLYDSALDAALAYDRAAVVLHGEFARTNADLGLVDAQGVSP